MSDRVQPVKRDKGDKPLTFDPARLRRRRFAAKMTVRDLAARANVSIGSISMMENGHMAPRVTMLASLADALNCSVEDLMPPEDTAGAA
jgi:transcriptional regulator with XRE-family HTH domain